MTDLDLGEISKFIGFSSFLEMYVMLAGYLVRYYPFFMDMIAMLVLELDDHFSSKDWKWSDLRLPRNVVVDLSNQPYQWCPVWSKPTLLYLFISVSVVTRSSCENKNCDFDVLLNFHYPSHYLSHQSNIMYHFTLQKYTLSISFFLKLHNHWYYIMSASDITQLT